MCFSINGRSPHTKNYPEEVSELDNWEWDNELSKPSENPEHPAATNVSTVEPHTTMIANNTQRSGIQRRPTRETRKGGKKVKFSNFEERGRLSKKWNLQKLQTRKRNGRPYWLHEPAKTEKQTFKFDSINRKFLLAKLGNIVAEEFV